MKAIESYVEEDRQVIHSTLTEPLWTVTDVAKYLRLKPETVRMMARARKIPAIKVGRVWRFRAREIREMLKTRMSRAAR